MANGEDAYHSLAEHQANGKGITKSVCASLQQRSHANRLPKGRRHSDHIHGRIAKGDFLYDLCKDPPETLSKLMYEAQKHMNAEDTFKSRDDPPPKRRKNVEDRKQEPAKQKVPKFSETPERKRTTTSTGKFSSFIPLNTPIDKLLMQIQDNPSFQ